VQRSAVAFSVAPELALRFIQDGGHRARRRPPCRTAVLASSAARQGEYIDDAATGTCPWDGPERADATFSITRGVLVTGRRRRIANTRPGTVDGSGEHSLDRGTARRGILASWTKPHLHKGNTRHIPPRPAQGDWPHAGPPHSRCDRGAGVTNARPMPTVTTQVLTAGGADALSTGTGALDNWTSHPFPGQPRKDDKCRMRRFRRGMSGSG